MGGIGSFCTGVVLGGVAGAVTALLITPKNGQENRQLVAEYASSVAQSAQEFSNNAYGQLQEGLKVAGDKGGEFIGNVKNVGEKASAQVSSTNDELRAKIEAARERITEQVKKNASETQEVVEVDEQIEKAKEEAKRTA